MGITIRLAAASGRGTAVRRPAEPDAGEKSENKFKS
jgi:hypothetical protein